MATCNCITRPPSQLADEPSSPHSHLLTAYLKVALTASERALLATGCPEVVHLVQIAHQNLLAAHDLVETDRKLAA